MADEIRIQSSIQVTNGALTIPQLGGAFTVDQSTAEGGTPGMVELAVAEEAIAFGDVTPSWVFIKNLHATNDVIFGPESGGAMVELGRVSPGEWVVIPLGSGVTLRMAASAATLNAQVIGISG